MRLPTSENLELVTVSSNTSGTQTVSDSASLQSLAYTSLYSYHELADIPVQEVDVLQALENNMNQLQDIQGRMQFMMREIRYLMKV